MERPVAVIEDSDEDYFALRRALAGSRGELTRYRDGDSALAHLREPNAPWPAVLLLDLNLPGTSGLDVLRALRSEPGLRRLPVVVLSGSDREEDIGEAYAAGANAYIIKPLEFGQLRHAMESMWAFWNLALVPRPPSGHDAAPGYGLL